MALKIFQGAADSGNRAALLSQIISESVDRPSENFLVIVPEQFSMETQKLLTQLHPRGGLLNIDVLSLAHLAYRVFSETGTRTAEMLEDNGKTLVLQHLLSKTAKDLPYLKSRVTRPEGIEAVKSLLSELMQYGISVDAVLDAAARTGGSLSEKMKDVGVVYERYLSYLSDTYLTSEELPVRLSKVISRSRKLADTTLAFDGFTGFTPVQLPVLRALMVHAKNVYVSVTISPDEPQLPDDLFLLGRRTVSSLLSIAAEEHVPVLAPLITRTAAGPKDPALAHLSASVFRPYAVPYPEKTEAVYAASCPDPRAELAFIANEIRRLVRTKALRYREIAVITGDLGGYGPYVKQIFTAEGLPFYLDEKRPVLHLRAVEFIRAAMQVFSEDWSQPSVFRLLRCGFLPLSADETDRLENYVLALGIRGKKRWTEPFTFHTKKMDPADLLSLNESREKTVSVLAPVHEAFAKGGGTAEEKTRALYGLCVRAGVQEQLAGYEETLRSRGEASKAGAYAQIYPVLMQLFDKIVTVLGPQPMSMKEYRALLESALAEISVGTLPPGSDLIKVGDMTRTRLSGIRVLFFAGVNEGLIPRNAQRGGLLSEADRAELTRLGISLSAEPREELAAQRFYLYLALSHPSDRLYLTFARSSTGGNVLRPAFLIREVLRLFPQIEFHSENAPGVRTVETLAQALRLLPEVTHPEPDDTAIWKSLYGFLSTAPEYALSAQNILRAAIKRPPQDSIGSAAAKALYGTHLTGSATRLELFAACAFRYFASYGLGLSEREEFRYTGADRGTLLHEGLRLYAERVRKSGRRWQDVPSEEMESLCRSCIQEACAGYGHMLFDESKNAYEIRRLMRLLLRTVRNLTEELSRGDFVPSGFEVAFRASALPVLSLPLKDGSLSLSGQIDRIDICEDGPEIYVKIVDYKSGSTDFRLSSVYHGLQLQLPVYLTAALYRTEEMTGKKAVPAALFYHPVSDPVIGYDPARDEGSLKEALLKEVRPSGLVSSEPRILGRLDRTLRPGTQSAVIPVSLNKNGSFAKGSHTASPEEMNALLRYIPRKLTQLGDAILGGACAALPRSVSGPSPCTFCPYASLCGFNSALEDGEKAASEDDAEVFLKMEEMLSADDPEAEGSQEDKEGGTK